MLSERLRAALNNAERLPPEMQERLAAEIESAIENALWDAELNDPQHDEVLRELIDEAKREPTIPFPTPREMGDEE